MKGLVRIVIVVLVVAATVWLLFTAVFPTIESYLENPSIGTSGAAQHQVSGKVL